MNQPNNQHPAEEFLRKNKLYFGKSPTLSRLLGCIGCRLQRQENDDYNFNAIKIDKCIGSNHGTVRMLLGTLVDVGVIEVTRTDGCIKVYCPSEDQLGQQFSENLVAPQSCPLQQTPHSSQP